MRYQLTYTDLSILIDEILDNECILKKLLILFKDFEEEIKFLIGINFFEINIEEGINLFKSNKYFTDALKIKILPSKIKILTANKLVYQKITVSEIIKKNLKNNDSNLSILNKNINTEKITQKEFNHLDKYGFLILKDVLSNDLCDELYEKTNYLARKELDSDIGGYIYGDGKMQRIYNLIAKDKIYRELITSSICHEVMKYMFQRPNYHDKYYLTSFHANILYANADSQIWHIDANVPDPIPPWIIRSNSNFIIQDYHSENGATEIIPGSHKYNKKPNLDQIHSEFNKTVFLEAPKGSVIFWHGHLWHRSGSNKTKNPRIALLGAYAASFFREVSLEENHFRSLSNEIDLSPSLEKILGWNHGMKNYS